MPRTIFGPGPSFPKDAQGLRVSAETQHRRQQEWAFLFPFTILAEDSGTAEEHSTNAVWRWQHPHYLNINYKKPRDDLTPEDYRRFCFKDCALYGVSARGTSRFLRTYLFERMYRHWFPSRAGDVDISHGVFFCEFIALVGGRSATAPATIGETAAFHKDLCSRLKRYIPELALPTPFTHGPFEPTQEHSLLSPRAEYKLRPSFECCFIYLHAEQSNHSMDSQVMKKRGLRVVFIKEADAAEHGCAEGATQGITRRRDEEQGLEGAVVFHCDTIETAMRIVLSKDSVRMEERTERHGYYSENLLDSSPGTFIPAKPCLCNRCVEEEGRNQL